MGHSAERPFLDTQPRGPLDGARFDLSGTVPPEMPIWRRFVNLDTRRILLYARRREESGNRLPLAVPASDRQP